MDIDIFDIEVKVQNRSGHPLPKYETENSAGMDLRAFLKSDVTLKYLERKLIMTGLYIELPPKTEAQIRPRSGLAYKHGITILNDPGTIDSDYRGEIKILLINFSSIPYSIKNGDRIAQMVISTYISARWKLTSEFSTTLRGKNGYGSTGFR